MSHYLYQAVGTWPTLGRFTPNQVHWKHMGLWVCSVMVICPSEPHGHAHGRNKRSWDLNHSAGDHPMIYLLIFWNYLWNWINTTKIYLSLDTHKQSNSSTCVWSWTFMYDVKRCDTVLLGTVEKKTPQFLYRNPKDQVSWNISSDMWAKTSKYITYDFLIP